MKNDLMEKQAFVLEDKRVDCLSIIHATKLSEYLGFAEKAYEDKGGIAGQRAPLKTKTAQTIRERMVADIVEGAVLPPIVIGVIVDNDTYESIKKVYDEKSFDTLNASIDKSSLSIIDGMQRTTALLEAVKQSEDVRNKSIRIEYWFSKSMNSLIYRMLVLNTGQVPWDIKRQLDTIYDSIIKDLKISIPNLDVRLIGQSSRRTQAGQYQSSKLIEYFLCFSSRKTDIDLKEKVSEDFARMDAIESTSDNDFLTNFKEVLNLMVGLDHEFSRFKDTVQDGRVKVGKDIFTSIPAGVGFVAAAATYIYGPPGFKSSKEESDKCCQDLILKVRKLIEKLNKLSEKELGDFLQFPLLNEKLSAKSNKIGQYEREFYFKAFEACLKYIERLEDFGPCWQAK
ncbi:hypothetical protein [Serratia marcescens]|uniref:hypothetical protein n=1 Tax=Serratia marcescens TaxID=615 RepID=UPI003F5CC2DA